jgi:hypothetical protein
MRVKGAIRVLTSALAAGAIAAGVGLAATQSEKPKPTPVAASTGHSAARSATAAHLPGWNADRNAYFGDLHVHTYLSNDAYISGVRRSPEDAYRFAQGQTITHADGYAVRLEGGPLDFTAVTDHSEYLSAVQEAAQSQSPLHDLPFSRSLFGDDPAQRQRAFSAFVEGMETKSLPKEYNDPAVISRGWREEQEAAARNYHPGRFTTFVAYEFTSAPDGRNLHRNVIFRSAKAPGAPFAASISQDPEDLWKTMDAWRAQGIEALAIPHNANGSDGLMFDSVRLNGKAMDRAYAELRARNEPLTEITQIKGTSETHPTLSPNDEWADFEIMERYIGRDKAITKFHGGYVRQALKDGILLRDKMGVNPFKLGFIGSSDNHNASPGAVEERNYFGASGSRDGTPQVRGSIPKNGATTWEGDTGPLVRQTRGASGIAGVWAEENSREAIFAALKRRETFATSGPRIRVRFFGGYDFPSDILARADAVRQAYAHGAPMGGDLSASQGKAPQFMVWAIRDPNSGYLQRAQIVKGWVENGQAKERVFDVACSDGGKPSAGAWRCPDNGAKVDLATCRPDRFKGDVQLQTVWTDPSFDPKQRAFYYVRVLENPTCRWSSWDALRNGTTPNPKFASTVMERAWSSPIWYEPAS